MTEQDFKEKQVFINGKPLEVSTDLNIDWKEFQKVKTEAEFKAVMECVKKEEFEHRLRFIHRTRIVVNN